MNENSRIYYKFNKWKFQYIVLIDDNDIQQKKDYDNSKSI